MSAVVTKLISSLQEQFVEIVLIQCPLKNR